MGFSKKKNAINPSYQLSNGTEFESLDYRIRHVADFNKLPPELDGRGQNYSWSAVEYGDYVYVGTAYNVINDIIVRFTSELVQSLGFSPEDGARITESLTQFLFDDQIYLPDERNKPMIVKIHKKTFEVSIISQEENVTGYRTAIVFNNKVYFVALTLPAILIEVDPETDDTTVVYESPSTEGSGGGIRALAVYHDRLIMSYNDSSGILVVASGRNNVNEWEEIANLETFANIPAYRSLDAQGGGGIWEMVVFNDFLYISIVPTMLDDKGEFAGKRGFALYKAFENNGEWSWDAVIGDTNGTSNHQARYPFGLAVNEPVAATLYVYQNYLYIGGYNDIYSTLSALGTGNFAAVNHTLKDPVNLYRMDANEDIQMVIGDPDKLFPSGGIGNMGSGFDDPMNQYVWRMAEYDGKLFVGTFDLSTLLNYFTQLTNGELSDYTLEDYRRRFEQFLNLYQDLMASEDNSILTETINNMEDDNILERLINYMKLSNHSRNAVKGFDLLVSEDGVNFKSLTRDGFGNEFSHGVRSAVPTNEGLFIGTANPFYGTDVWVVQQTESEDDSREKNK